MSFFIRVNTQKKLRVLFIGGESTGLQCLKYICHNASLDLVFAVISANPTSINAFEKYNKLNSIKTISLEALEIHAETQHEAIADIIISVNNPHIISNKILDKSTYGGINIHPGKLPEYSGMNPVSWAIVNGEDYHFVTLHQITELIDGGDILSCKKFKIEDDDNAYTLIAKSCKHSVVMIQEFLERLVSKDYLCLSGAKQDMKCRVYYGNKSPIEFPIDLQSKLIVIHRLYRCSFFGPLNSPWGYPRIEHDGKIRQFKASIFKEENHEFKPGSIIRIQNECSRIYCVDGWIQGFFLEDINASI